MNRAPAPTCFPFHAAALAAPDHARHHARAAVRAECWVQARRVGVAAGRCVQLLLPQPAAECSPPPRNTVWCVLVWFVLMIAGTAVCSSSSHSRPQSTARAQPLLQQRPAPSFGSHKCGTPPQDQLFRVGLVVGCCSLAAPLAGYRGGLTAARPVARGRGRAEASPTLSSASFVPPPKSCCVLAIALQVLLPLDGGWAQAAALPAPRSVAGRL